MAHMTVLHLDAFPAHWAPQFFTSLPPLRRGRMPSFLQTMSGHGQPVTGVLWEQASHVLLSVSVDGTLRMYDGKALEQWDMLQLVSTRVPALSECGIRTDGTELPDMVTPTGVHLVEAHSGGFYIGITVGPSVVFVDVQPSKKFRGTLPHPAVQIMPRAHTVPSWWPKVTLSSARVTTQPAGAPFRFCPMRPADTAGTADTDAGPWR